MITATDEADCGADQVEAIGTEAVGDHSPRQRSGHKDAAMRHTNDLVSQPCYDFRHTAESGLLGVFRKLAWFVSHETVLAERVDQTDRVRDKDALDVLRLLRAIETDKLANRLRTLRSDELARFVTSEALELLLTLFGNEAAAGVEMAVRGAGDADDAATIAGSFVALVEDLGANLA